MEADREGVYERGRGCCLIVLVLSGGGGGELEMASALLVLPLSARGQGAAEEDDGSCGERPAGDGALSMTPLESRFWAALTRLETWHSDSLKAQDFSGPQTSSSKPGSVELRVTPYPHYSYWTNEWRKAKDDEGREEVIRGLEGEWFELAISPSKKYGTFSYDTLEWKVAIANQDAPAKNVARIYGVAVSTVYLYRKKFRQGT